MPQTYSTADNAEPILGMHRQTACPETDVLVSVIVPVYNTIDYLEEALDAVRMQFDSHQLEIIAVDDGSTDGSGELLDRIAERESRLRVLHQPNSGGPSQPRNLGLDHATGRYVYFADADDVLAPDALSDMSRVADEQGSDVVLGRMGGLNGRGVSLRPFRKTELDADVLESHAWDTLAPSKLFRRSLIESLGVRFPTDQWVGEDQPFTATMYFNARKISVLSDRVYVYLRRREDSGNLTSRRQSLQDKLKTTCRLGEIVYRNTEAGQRRDALMLRVFTSTLPPALGHILVNATQAEAASFLTVARNRLAPYYSRGIASSCSPLLRYKIDLLVGGHHDQLLALAKLDLENRGVPLRVRGGVVRLDIPEALELGEEDKQSEVTDYLPPVLHELTVFEFTAREFRICGVAGFSEVIDPVDEVRVVLVNRDTNDECYVPTSIRRRFAEGLTAKAEFEVQTSVMEHLPVGATHKGAWGIFVELTTNGLTRRARFGQKVPFVGEQKYALGPISSTDPGQSVIAYFNHGFRNLTFDVNSFVHKAFSMPSVVGCDVLEEGGGARPTVMVLVESVTVPRPLLSGSGTNSTPPRKVGKSIYTITYPISVDSTTRVGVSVRLDDIVCHLAVPPPAWLESSAYSFQLSEDHELVISPRG